VRGSEGLWIDSKNFWIRIKTGRAIVSLEEFEKV